MKQLLFNPKGNDSKIARKVFKGNSTNIINLNNVKYNWATRLYTQMRANFWIPQKFDLTQDKVTYKELIPEEQKAFNGMLSFLVYLDSIQVTNLPHLKPRITAPEIRLCLSEQESQEGMHGQSYQYMIESIIDEEKRNDIYDYWRTDKILNDRCLAIGQTFQEYINRDTEPNYFKALFADYILEGIYFYQGFIFFYSLAARGLMNGCADIFRLINIDELSHVRLFQELVKEAMKTYTFDEQWIYDFTNQAVQKDINWNLHSIGDRILGITKKSIEEYSKYLGNIRLKAIGLKEIYPYVKNPYKHLENIADNKSEASLKVNFFDGTASYQQSNMVAGFDEF